MREPGCNGAVCYCNDGDFCNCKGSLCNGAALGSPTNQLQLVLAILCSMVGIKSHKTLRSNLGRIALLGSYRIWLARRSQEWSSGELIRAT